MSSEYIIDPSPAPMFDYGLRLQRWWSVLLAGLLSVVLLVLSFEPFGCWPLAYISLAPWGLGMAAGFRRGLTLLTGWVCGLIFWAVMLWWIAISTWTGYVGAVVYLSMFWLLASWFVRGAMRRRWPMWLVLPVVWVAVDYVRGYGVAFEWFTLAQSQYRQTQLIQAADATGQAGVTFFVAMVNGWLLDVLWRPILTTKKGKTGFSRTMVIGGLACLSALACLLGYGAFRLRQSRETASPGPRIALIQEAFPISLTTAGASSWEILEAHIKQTLPMVGDAVDLVVWPETMIPMGLNDEFLEADAATMADAEVNCLAKAVFQMGAEKYTVSELREYLNRFRGLEEREDYGAPAVQWLVGTGLTPEQIMKLPEPTVKQLVRRGLSRQSREGDDILMSRLLLIFLTPQFESWFKANGERLDVADQYMDLHIRFAPNARGGPEGVIDEAREIVHESLKMDQKILRSARRGQAAILETLSIIMDAPILVGGTSIRRTPNPLGPEDLWTLSNSVIWFQAKAPKPAAREYHKVHLVPFSEYVPFKYSFTWLHRLFRKAVPEAMPQLEPGREFVRFRLPDRQGGEDYQIATPICFEGTFGYISREMAAAGSKNRLVLINMSNDGWFVVNGEGTTEQTQHMVNSVFRAVENRVPVLRAVNTGITASINSNGQITRKLTINTKGHSKDTMVAGRLCVQPLVDCRTSPYQRWPGFAMLNGIAALVLACWLLVSREPQMNITKG